MVEATSPRGLPVEAEENAAARIRALREAHGWSTATVAERMTKAGHPINQSAVWRIESGEPRRRINLDEAIGFAKVFDITVERLIAPPDDAAVEYLNRLIHTYIATWRAADATRYGAAEIRAGIDATLAATPELRDVVEGMLAEAVEAEERGEFRLALAPEAHEEEGIAHLSTMARLRTPPPTFDEP
ncbi:helix-turn-helix domain-containing protein [Yinghuangia sp. YIM S10712]|uniref:helix-turn-helix domain-containing protein n=1 Tax=Yinghuangia sp. YIM S10712 TaxID=3436930 RepID=UPI003F53A626